MELELWTGQGNSFNNGFCAELEWIFNLKEEFQTFMWDYFSYLVQSFTASVSSRSTSFHR